MKRPLYIAGLVFSVLAAIYSFLGIMMAFWVAQVPGNSPQHIRLNFLVWVPATVAFSFLAALFAYKLVQR
jgi:hypothetical protein